MSDLIVRAYRLGSFSSHEFRPYVYGGNVPLEKDPGAHVVRAGERRREFSPDKCGTPAGHERHRYWNVPICQRCRDAKTKYRAERKAEIQARKEARHASDAARRG